MISYAGWFIPYSHKWGEIRKFPRVVECTTSPPFKNIFKKNNNNNNNNNHRISQVLGLFHPCCTSPTIFSHGWFGRGGEGSATTAWKPMDRSFGELLGPGTHLLILSEWWIINDINFASVDFEWMMDQQWIHSLKLTAKAPENGWLEDEFPFGFRPIFRGELLVSGRVDTIYICFTLCICVYIYIHILDY